MNHRPDYRSIEAKVVEVIDGDTLRLDIHLWPGLTMTINVRSRGVDTPELSSDCSHERELVKEAKASIERKFPVGSWVFVNYVKFDKYGDRTDAEIKRWFADRFRSVTE